MALSDDQKRELERQQLAAQTLSQMMGDGRMANRPRQDRIDLRKQAFIDDFIASGKMESYPFDDDDIADENRYVEYDGNATLRQTLVAEIRYAFDLLGAPDGLDPSVVAFELLRSEHGDELHRLKDMPLSRLSLDLILAHVETFDYGMSKRLAASVARRTFIAILNRHHFKPDARPKHRQTSDLPS